MPETLRIEREDEVTHVVLTGTTMPPRFFEELALAFEEIGRDSDVRAVIVRSAARAFSYGLDLPTAFQELGPALSGGGARDRMKLLRTIQHLQSRLDAVAKCPVPVIAAVHGWCIGGGVDLISACDLRICSADARFSVRETRLAIVADLGSLQRLPFLIGQGHTRDLAFTGKDIDAPRAREIGLVNDVYDDAARLLSAARELGAAIAKNPPLTVRGVKRVLDFGIGKPPKDGLDYVAAYNSAFLASEDLGEALSAFLEKREPNYRGR
jgi:enoyl-CoA hydratase